MLSDFQMSCLILFRFTCLFSLLQWNSKVPITRVIEYFSILRPMKNDVRFEYVQWKNAWFCSVQLLGFTLVIKLRILDLESHWNTLIFFDKKDMVLDLIMSCQTVSDFVQALFLNIILAISWKIRILDLIHFILNFNSLKFFNSESVIRSKFLPMLFVLLVFVGITMETVLN